MDGSIHLEFYGVPGSGKSTVSELVARELEVRGVSVCRASAAVENMGSPAARRLIKLFRAASFTLSHPALTASVRRLAAENGYKTAGDRCRQTVNVIQKLHLYAKADPGVYIWDEGLTQAAVSLSVGGDVKSAHNESALLELSGNGPRRVRIYLREDPDVVLKRLEKRKTNDSRVEKESDPARRRKLLEKFCSACDGIEPDIVIDGSDESPSAVARKVLETLDGRLPGELGGHTEK